MNSMLDVYNSLISEYSQADIDNEIVYLLMQNDQNGSYGWRDAVAILWQDHEDDVFSHLFKEELNNV